MSAEALEKLRKEVEKAAEGLVFISESDARVVFVSAPEARVTEVTPEAVVTWLSAKHDGRTDVFLSPTPLPRLAEKAVEVKSAGDFLARRTEVADPSDPESGKYASQWSQIRQALEEHLQELRVIRFGEAHRGSVDGQISVFVVGRTQEGALAGILTGSVET
ncbi:nuclease A inhibitor family protein [Hyalangium rubrum]|uniref:Nuclease A inhibitor family protein n=1 Tax=Hyalangium rubrum TaxID=3103134 RepID=A0ABU5HCN1_9BACT|nr:nuclease A inhibitor family protein [Hyalangium sp. s54d21]MDY7231218.1 nuclease A inhibitor family protein [Hyalangium sp. s54d21]